MRRRKVWRYYCDHCKKSGCSGGHVAKHEKGCTLNPERECGYCRMAEYSQVPMAELIVALGAGDEAGMTKLREVSENCPACILAAIRQSGILERDNDRQSACNTCLSTNCEVCPKGLSSHFRAFDFKKEAAEFWAEYNDEQRRNDPASYAGCW